MATYRKTPIVPLETVRLWLRPLQESDAPRIQLLFPRPNMVQYMSSAIPWPYPPDGAMDLMSKALPKIEAQEEFLWAILRKGREQEGLIGLIALTPDSDEDHRGFWIAEAYWGQGLMSEATAAVNDFAFDVLGMEAMLMNNAEPNVASHRLKESIGAEIIAVRDADFIGGRFREIRWRLTAESWRRYRTLLRSPLD